MFLSIGPDGQSIEQLIHLPLDETSITACLLKCRQVPLSTRPSEEVSAEFSNTLTEEELPNHYGKMYTAFPMLKDQVAHGLCLLPSEKPLQNIWFGGTEKPPRVWIHRPNRESSYDASELPLPDDLDSDPDNEEDHKQHQSSNTDLTSREFMTNNDAPANLELLTHTTEKSVGQAKEMKIVYEKVRSRKILKMSTPRRILPYMPPFTTPTAYSAYLPYGSALTLSQGIYPVSMTNWMLTKVGEEPSTPTEPVKAKDKCRRYT